MDQGNRRIGHIVFWLCEAFAVCTLFMMLKTRDPMKLCMCIGTMLLLCAPAIVERLFRCRISLPVYLFILLYAIGPMLGYCHNLYYLTCWWDKLLHTCGGVAFALFGTYLYMHFSGSRSYVMCGIFAFCFSVTLSVMWEFFEFAADTFLGTDMQNDTVITALNSYFLSSGLGEVGSINGIEQVTVNGQVLPVAGYLDIGLIDSMLDMLLESAGALVVAVVHIADKGIHPVITEQKGRSL